MTCGLWQRDGLTEFKNMKCTGLNKGFTIVELLTVLAILVIMAGALLKVAKYVRESASEDLTKSTMSVIVTALEQYHDDNKSFPVADYDVTAMPSEFRTFITAGFPSLEESVEADLGVDVDLTQGAGVHDDEYASIEAMYFFLSRSLNSSQILSAITDKFFISKDSNEGSLTAEWLVGGVPKTVPLIRIVDTWGNAFRYRYTAGDSFPVIVSAGADGDFSAAGDNISSDDL